MTQPSEEFMCEAERVLTRNLGHGWHQSVEALATALQAAADKARTEDELLLKSAHDALCKAGGTALGVAMSGRDHPDPDGALTGIFNDTSPVAKEIAIRLVALQVAADNAVSLTYTNYRREVSVRTITPRRVWFGSTEWHPEPQWLLTAFDHDKGAERDFALKDFGAVPDGYALVPIKATDEMIKAANLSEEGWAAEIWSAMLAALTRGEKS